MCAKITLFFEILSKFTKKVVLVLNFFFEHASKFKKIFKNTFKPIIYSVSLIINSLICGALTYYLFIIDDSDLLAGFGALIIGTSWAMALFVLIIYNICQYIRFVIKK